MKQLTNHVYVEPRWPTGTQRSAGSTSSFVVTSDGIVMIDAPSVPANSVKWLTLIEEQGKLLYLVNTGCHSDHTSGNYFFPVPVIAHEQTRKAIPFNLTKDGNQAERLKRNHPSCAELVKNYFIRLPSLTFSDRLTMYVGDQVLELLHMPGHSPGETGVYLPREKVLFTGDNFANGYQPKMSDCLPLEQLDALKKMLDMDVEYYVPGHGDPGDKQAVRNYLVIFQGCVDAVRGAIERGLTRNEAMEQIRLPIPETLVYRHPEPEQLKIDVGRLYDGLAIPRSEASRV